MLRAPALSPVSISSSRPSCSTAQQWIGSGCDHAPGRNRSSWRRGPVPAYRNACLTVTVPVLRAWMRMRSATLHARGRPGRRAVAAAERTSAEAYPDVLADLVARYDRDTFQPQGGRARLRLEITDSAQQYDVV